MISFAYSVSNIHSSYDEIYGGFFVFNNLKSVVEFLRTMGVYPHELLNENLSYKIRSYSAENKEGEKLDPNILIEKVKELSKQELDDIDKIVEEKISKQEKEDREYLEKYPGKYLPRFSGVFYLDRKDKQKYIDQLILRDSWRWKE